jgi:hypothetical protein
MKLLEKGYFYAMHRKPVIDTPTRSQAIRGTAAVVGVVALVLALLVSGVYAVVALDLMPLMH